MRKIVIPRVVTHTADNYLMIVNEKIISIAFLNIINKRRYNIMITKVR